MPITHDELLSLLQHAFPGGSISLTDMAGDNDHWSATVSSQMFAGKSRIEQHRMVQDAVKDKNIHALAIKTLVSTH